MNMNMNFVELKDRVTEFIHTVGRIVDINSTACNSVSVVAVVDSGD